MRDWPAAQHDKVYDDIWFAIRLIETVTGRGARKREDLVRRLKSVAYEHANEAHLKNHGCTIGVYRG